MTAESISQYLFIYQISAAVLSAAGLWAVLAKCGGKGWWALIPAYRTYKLGECSGREKEGRICMFLELAVLLIQLIMKFFMNPLSPDYFYLTVGVLALVLIRLIYIIRLYSGLVLTFDRRKIWIAGWVFAGWLTAIIFGFSKSFVPVNLGRVHDDELLAGTRPADIDFGDYISRTGKEGLAVILKDRVIRDFSKKRYLLKDIYFTIPNNSLVLLLGGSGSGKTTLVNAILGYEKANAQIFLNGVNIYDHYEQMKYRIGFVPQQDLLRLHDTVYKTLLDAAKLRLPADTSAKDMKKRIEDVMNTLGLTAGAGGLVSKKSGGMRKRISIGTELISNPELFILDEPDSGLDGVIARELFEKLADVAHQGNIVLTITHIPDRVADLFDQVIVLARDSGRVGRLAFCGTPDEARAFFEKDTMEEIVMCVNKKEEGGEGRADEFIARYSEYMRKKYEETGAEGEAEDHGE